MKIEIIEQTVDAINGEILEQNQEMEELDLLIHVSNGSCHNIKYLGNYIWNSEDSDMDENEDFYNFIRRKVREINGWISTIKLPM